MEYEEQPDRNVFGLLSDDSRDTGRRSSNEWCWAFFNGEIGNLGAFYAGRVNPWTAQLITSQETAFDGIGLFAEMPRFGQRIDLGEAEINGKWINEGTWALGCCGGRSEGS